MEKNKARFDKQVTPSVLEVGDRVLVRNMRLCGKHKLEDKWEHDVYVVVSRAGDLPVYTVRLEKTLDGPTWTLHRDLLLPCGFLPASVEDELPFPDPIHRTEPKPAVSHKLTRILLKAQWMTKWTLSCPCTVAHLLDSEWT